jgi:hypothetical protein
MRTTRSSQTTDVESSEPCGRESRPSPVRETVCEWNRRALADELRALVREHKPALLVSALIESVVARLREMRSWSVAEWGTRRDRLLADMNRMDVELARRGETVADYGWGYTARGAWYRLPA